MKRTSLLTQDDEIDLLEFIGELWKEKILVISVSFLFMAIGYIYGTLQPTIHKKKIILRDAPIYLFESKTLSEKDNVLLAKEFNKEFRIILSKPDTLDRFVDQNNKIDQFKIKIASKNIDIKKYFNREFEIDEKNNLLVYYLTYGEYSPGEQFLDDFIFFVKQETENAYKIQRSFLVNNLINLLEENLEISKQINLESPQEIMDGSNALYSRGMKVLNHQINNLKKNLNENKLMTLDYNPVVAKSSSVDVIINSPLKFATIAFLLGFFFSIIVILIRVLLQNKLKLKT